MRYKVKYSHIIENIIEFEVEANSKEEAIEKTKAFIVESKDLIDEKDYDITNFKVVKKTK
jgi:hypothetical protein